MLAVTAALAILSAGMYAPAQIPTPRPPVLGVELRYDPPLGEVARYRVSLKVEGEQVSLGERLPVAWKAEAQVTEEVVARESDGSFWLRTTARLSDVTGGNGMFANGAPTEWPEVRLHLSRRGEVLETARADIAGESGVREQALASLISESSPIILPHGAVQSGDAWQVEAGGARQSNRLVSLQGEGDSRVARVASVATWPLTLDESVPELGLETHLTGEARETSESELLVRTGLVRRQKGRTHLVTKSEVTLSLPDGPKVFPIESNLTVTFDIRLISVDGRPMGSR